MDGKKSSEKKNLNIVEKFSCFNQKREITEKTVKIKKWLKKTHLYFQIEFSSVFF